MKNNPALKICGIKIDIVVVAMLFMIAVAVRVLPWNHVFYGGHIYFPDQDCYIRLRKIWIYLASFPKTYVYDYFQGFPEGTGIITPPTMEYIIAAFVYPFRTFSSLPSFLEKLIAVIPPLLGGITIVVFYGFMQRYFSRLSAFIAALIFAFSPHHVEATMLGRFDNEMTEPLLFLLICRTYAITFEEQENKKHWILTGVMSALYLTLWRGALFPLTIIGIDLIRRIVSVRRSKADLNELTKSAAMMYLTTFGIIAIICITNIWGSRNIFSYNIISNFHSTLFALTALFIYALKYIISDNDSSNKRRPLYLILLLIVLTVSLFVFRVNIIEGTKVVIGGNAWLDSIGQYKKGYDDLNIYYFGLIPFLSPFMLILLFRQELENISIRKFLIIWTMIFFIATAFRMRFAIYYVCNAALLAGVMVHYVQISTNTKRYRALSAAAAVLVLFLLQIPTYYYFRGSYLFEPASSIKGDIEETMLWLRHNTPPAGDPYRPNIRPHYAVLAPWNYGGYIESIAHRPSIATAYGTETYGMATAASFFLSTEEAEMTAILQKNGTRYILLDSLPDIDMYAKLVGDKRIFMKKEWDPARRDFVNLRTPQSFSLIASRLFFCDGAMTSAGRVVFKPVEGVRLVYESRSAASFFGFPWELKKIKLFEYSKGATLVIKGTPGKVAAISQPVETNQGRRFTYYNEKKISSDGTANFSHVYKRKTAPHTSGALAPPTVAIDNKKTVLMISDDDVDRERIIIIQ